MDERINTAVISLQVSRHPVEILVGLDVTDVALATMLSCQRQRITPSPFIDVGDGDLRPSQGHLLGNGVGDAPAILDPHHHARLAREDSGQRTLLLDLSHHSFLLVTHGAAPGALRQCGASYRRVSWPCPLKEVR